MKKIICILFIIFTFIIFNYKLFLSGYYNNKANIEYKSWNFIWATNLYNKSINYKLKSNNLHNLWNTYFYLWKDTENQFELYNKSLESFSWSLKIEFNENTKYNYDYVLEKLTSPQSSPQGEEEDQKWEGKWENTSPQSSPWGEEEDQKWEDEKGQENQGEEKELSNWEYQQLKEYVENLKEGEELYQDYFNKAWKSDNDIFEYFNNPFFDDEFDRWSEKDW